MENEKNRKNDISRKKEIKEAELTVIYFGEDVIITSGGTPGGVIEDFPPDD